MKNFKLKLSSKNKETINYFCLHFFNRTNIKHNFKIIKKFKYGTKKTKKVTILTSPHVYKTAQEQFEYKIFYQNFNLLVTNYKKFLLLLKKIKTNRFSDINIQLTFKIQKFNNYFFTNYLQKNLNYFFLNNFFVKKKKKNNFFIIKEKEESKKLIKNLIDIKTKTSSNLLKIFDVLGEKIISQSNIKF